MTKYWIGVASKDHVALGVQGGFSQLCHGKSAPLNRMSVGDKLIYYSPKEALRSPTPCQKFTALGTVVGEKVYPYEMSPDFIPFRKDIDYDRAIQEVPLAAIRGFDDWEEARAKLRFGHFEISEELFSFLQAMMKK